MWVFLSAFTWYSFLKFDTHCIYQVSPFLIADSTPLDGFITISLSIPLLNLLCVDSRFGDNSLRRGNVFYLITGSCVEVEVSSTHRAFKIL